RVPGQRELRGRVGGAGEVEIRRQGRARRHLAGRDDLRDREGLDRGGLALRGVDEGERRVGGAEVDPDDKATHVSSTSAGGTVGARRVASRPSPSAGRLTRAARQPWWRSVPLNGPAPLTLPTRRIFAGSKPVSTVTASSSSAASTGSTPKCSTRTFLQPLWMSRTAAPMAASS